MMKFDLEKTISVLERTPSVLKVLLKDLPTDWICKDEGPNTWSPFDVVGHLIHGENTDWMVRTNLILNKGPEVTFEPYDRFAQFENSKGKSLDELLSEFEELRMRNLKSLQSKNLSHSDFNRTGIHPELGVVTLAELLSAWVVHDLGHLAQVSRVMAKQYIEEVGPWTKYLTILGYTPKE